jgi:hypothetical protein
MVFNIFTARFMEVKKACEVTKSSKPVFLCTTSFAEANKLCTIRDKMPLPSSTFRLDASFSSDRSLEDEESKQVEIGLERV